MNKMLVAAVAAVAIGWVAATPVLAATDAQKQAAIDKWQNMTPEQKEAAKAKMQSKYNAMTPEQQQKFAEKHPQAAARLQAKSGAPAPAVAPAPAQ